MPVQTTYRFAPEIGFAGQVVDNRYTLASVNAEASAAIPAGAAVIFYNADSNDLAVRLPSAITQEIKGIVTHSHAREFGRDLDSDTDGNNPGAVMNVMRVGVVMAICENGCVPGDRLHVRALGGTAGALRSAADASNTRDCTAQGQWLSTASAGGLAMLAVNFETK